MAQLRKVDCQRPNFPEVMFAVLKIHTEEIETRSVKPTKTKSFWKISEKKGRAFSSKFNAGTILLLISKMFTVSSCWPTNFWPRKKINTPRAIHWLIAPQVYTEGNKNGKRQEGRPPKQQATKIKFKTFFMFKRPNVWQRITKL